jgi:ADP-ribosyl-[dinitrogen reductase] hydrolase
LEKDMSSVRDRVEGILLGLAAGDRNGGPIRMAVRLADSLIECSKVDVSEIATRYLDWWHEGAFDTGPTAARVFTLVDSGLSFDDASQQVHLETGQQTAGCNPTHRSAPLAMLPGLHTDQLVDFAVQEAALTHRHPLSGDVAAAVVVTCSELVRGASWQDAIDSACTGRLHETTAALEHHHPDSLNIGGFAPDVLAAAVHFIETSDTFDTALEASLNFAGPANYCPVLVGSIGGATWGASSISDTMLDQCEMLPRVRLAATGLADQWM